ncbi:MAG: LysR family transcriptional regulator ArgP [Thermodesulfobacteriota bacterium]
MLDYRLVEALAAVVLEGGFDRAARSLNLTQPAVSQRVKALEDALGTLLVVRSTPPRATAEGQRVVEHFLKVGQLEDDLSRGLALEQEEDWTSLRIGVNADSLATWLLGALRPFLEQERVLLDVSVEDQDLAHELLREGRVAACLAARAEPLQGCRSLALGRMDYLCLATPAFADRWFPNGLDADSAQRAPAVVFNRKDRMHARFLAGLLGREIRFPAHYLPSSEQFLELVAAGLAYGMAPELQSRERLAAGELVNLAPGRSEAAVLYWHTWGLRTRRLDRLTAQAVRGARTVLAP